MPRITNYVKTVAREIRDIPTAAATVVKTVANVKPSQGGGTPTKKSTDAINKAGSNFGQQLKEVGSAIVSGKSGTTSAQSKIKREVTPGTKRK